MLLRLSDSQENSTAGTADYKSLEVLFVKYACVSYPQSLSKVMPR